jgi:hypothetical protein
LGHAIIADKGPSHLLRADLMDFGTTLLAARRSWSRHFGDLSAPGVSRTTLTNIAGRL